MILYLLYLLPSIVTTPKSNETGPLIFKLPPSVTRSLKSKRSWIISRLSNIFSKSIQPINFKLGTCFLVGKWQKFIQRQVAILHFKVTNVTKVIGCLRVLSPKLYSLPTSILVHISLRVRLPFSWQLLLWIPCWSLQIIVLCFIQPQQQQRQQEHHQTPTPQSQLARQHGVWSKDSMASSFGLFTWQSNCLNTFWGEQTNFSTS